MSERIHQWNYRAWYLTFGWKLEVEYHYRTNRPRSIDLFWENDWRERREAERDHARQRTRQPQSTEAT